MLHYLYLGSSSSAMLVPWIAQNNNKIAQNVVHENTYSSHCEISGSLVGFKPRTL